MKIGIFGGSFDPVHLGHINLARYALGHAGLDAVWLMVSPRNPLKEHGPLASDEQRLEMARLAVADIPGIEVSDFEFSLPRPSYSWLTLTELQKAYPQHSFRLIIGADNWADFDRWRNPDLIRERFGLIVYPRPGEIIADPPRGVTVLQGAPQMDISSTRIRALFAEEERQDEDLQSKTEPSADTFLSPEVMAYIRNNSIYCSAAE